MTRILVAGLALLGSLGFAIAQQQADPAVLQRVIAVLEQQRNGALNAQANAETRVLGLVDENEKLKARVKELEAAPAKPDPAAK